MSGYELKSGYDYSQHWSIRDRKEPRLAGKTHEESLETFHRQFGEALAMDVYKDYTEENLTKRFDEILQRYIYDMAMQNLYGFGKFVLNGTLEPVINDLYNRMLPYFEKSIVHWWTLSIQCGTNRNECADEAAWRTKFATYISHLEKFGVNVDYQEQLNNEIERVRAYIAHEDAWIKRSGGWRGD